MREGISVARHQIWNDTVERGDIGIRDPTKRDPPKTTQTRTHPKIMSHYMISQYAISPKIKEDNPGITCGQISKLTYVKYAAMTTVEKKPYSTLSIKDKDLQYTELYSYCSAGGGDNSGRSNCRQGPSHRKVNVIREGRSNTVIGPYVPYPLGLSIPQIIFRAKDYIWVGLGDLVDPLDGNKYSGIVECISDTH